MPPRATLALAHWEAIWLGIGPAVFQARSGGLTRALPPDHTERQGPDQQDPVLVSPIWVLPASPLEALPLPRISLGFSRGFPSSQLAVRDLGYWVALSGLKPPNLASLDGQAFALALAGELRAGL